MKHKVLKRHSTDQQDALQQTRTIDRYLKLHGIIPVEIVEESEHGDVPFMERELGRMIMNSERGTTIIVSEYSRLNRGELEDSFAMIKAIKDQEVILYAIEENQTFNGMKVDDMLYLQTLMSASKSKAEIDRIRSRTKSSLGVRKDAIDKDGFFIAKRSKRKIKKMGNTTNLEYAQELGREASVAKRIENARKNKKLRQAWMMANLLKEAKRTNTEIVNELNYSEFTTLSGGKFSTKNIKRFIETYRKIYAPNK